LEPSIDHEEVTIIHPYNRSIQYIEPEQILKEKKATSKNTLEPSSKADLGKYRQPRAPSIAELLDGPAKGSQVRRVGSQDFSGRGSVLVSRDGTPRKKGKEKAMLSIMNNPIFIEKHRGKVNRLKAEKLINTENPEFARLIRKMTGDEKTLVVKLIKITREQLREHMLRKYPREITDRFIQVMDFPSTFDVKTYLEFFKNLLTDNLDLPYFFCFELFDFNNDDMINHRDIFTLFKLADVYPFLRNDYYKLVTSNNRNGLQKLQHLTAKQIIKQGGGNRGTESSQPRVGYVVNKNSLTQQVNVLKHVENMISKQEKHRLINLTQYKMVHQTELYSYLNYHRGKFKHKCLLELANISLTNPAHNKKYMYESPSSLISQHRLNTIMDDKPEPTKKIHEIPVLMKDPAKDLELVASWGDHGVNVLGFADIFSEDMPHLFYDILFHCTLVAIPGYEYKFNQEEIFELYNRQPISKTHHLGTLGSNDNINSKYLKTLSSLHPDGIDESFTKLSSNSDDD